MNAHPPKPPAAGSPFAGLRTIMVITFLVLASPLLYFLIQLSLGNEYLFHFNGW